MYWLAITVSAEIMYLLSEKTYVHRKNIPQDTDPGIGIQNGIGYQIPIRIRCFPAYGEVETGVGECVGYQ